MAHESQLLARGTPPSSKPRPKARGKPPRRKGHGDGGKKGKRRSCGLPRMLGPHEQLLSHLPTYRSSHPSHLLTSLLPDVSPYLLFLLLPLVLPPSPRRRPHCSSTKRGREGTPLAQQDVDAKARRSLNKTFLYKDDCAPNNCCTSESLGRTRPESCALSPRAIDGPHIITFCRTSTASSYTCCALSSFFCFLRLSAIPSVFRFLRPLFLSDFSFRLC